MFDLLLCASIWFPSSCDFVLPPNFYSYQRSAVPCVTSRCGANDSATKIFALLGRLIAGLCVASKKSVTGAPDSCRHTTSKLFRDASVTSSPGIRPLVVQKYPPWRPHRTSPFVQINWKRLTGGSVWCCCYWSWLLLGYDDVHQLATAIVASVSAASWWTVVN